MKITEFNLLEIDVYDKDKLLYSGKCEEAPEELKQKEIAIDNIQGKKLIIKLV